MKDLKNVDRVQYLIAAKEIIAARPWHENIIRLSYAEPVSTRVPKEMKWLTEKSDYGTESGQLYPHHFHAAYLRILTGHGVLPLLLYGCGIILLWRYNKYLSLGLAVCSLSMSVPYLTLFFGALQIAMIYPPKKKQP